MAIVEKKEDIFKELLKKYKGAAQAREHQNAVRGNEYTRELDNINKDVEAFEKRYARAEA